jgi:leucyl aminopeptidase (aminopeptidase T)
MKLAEILTAIIAIDSTESDAYLADVPVKRVQERQKASQKFSDKLLERNVRLVSLGNGLYPTEARAKQYGLSKAELAKLFHAGLDVDYDKMQATGEAVRKALAGGKKVHVTSPDGTDLTFEVAKRPVLVSDGVLSDEKVKKGGAACQVWLPAGEVYLVPVAGTAEGKLYVERTSWEGKQVRGLSLTFARGKMTSMKAKSGLDRLQEAYDAGDKGRDELTSLDVGINPAVTLPKDSPGVFLESGTITIGVGNNSWAGGENRSSFGMGGFLRGGTLKVDDVVLVKDGVLQLPK